MNYRKFGETNMEVSDICLGTMQFRWTVNESDSYKILDAYYDAGGNFVDTADMYTQWAKGFKGGESETVIGNWMKQKGNRQKVILATKVRCKMWEGSDGEGLSRSHILKACDDSLQRLQTDHIDLYQSHWSDPKTPIEETLSAYDTLVRQGKVRFIGCSNYSAKEMEEAHQSGEKVGTQFICSQPHYNLIKRKDFEKNILPLILRHKMAVIPYSPLAGGFLTGKYKKGLPVPESARAKEIVDNKMTERNLSVVETLAKMGKKYGKTVLQLALGWLLSHEWLTAPIIGANSIKQLEESMGASGFRLNSEDKSELDLLTEGL